MFFFYSGDGGIPLWILIIIGIIGTIYFISMIVGQIEERNFASYSSQDPAYSLQASAPHSLDYYFLALLHFSVRIIRADREKPLELKLNFIEDYLLPLLGASETRKRMCEIQDAEIKDINIYSKIGSEFHYQANWSEKKILLDFLISLASTAGNISNPEMKALRSIVDEIGISFEFDAFELKYYKTQQNISNDYKILEIESSATNDEVKKAYYEQMTKYHPDRVNHLGEHLKKFANEYCVRLNEAYERIKKKRGMV